MKEDLISFETAKLAKEKGFNIHYWENYTIYTSDKKLKREVFDINSKYIGKVKLGGNTYFAATQSLLQKWLREVHNLSLTILHLEKWTDDNNGMYCVFDYDLKNIESGVYHIVKKPMEFKTYEEALEQGLLEGLKLIK